MTGTFTEERRHILAELIRLSNSVDKLQDVALGLAVELGALKATNAVKAGFWGSVGGIGSGILLSIVIKEIFK